MQTHEVFAHTPTDGFRTRIEAGAHHLVADEPVDKGGTDEGPSPYELLAAALAACTTITLTMYAQRKQLDVRSIGARVSHSKVHADDCETCDRNSMIDEFRREIVVDGKLTGDQRDRLLYIADRCPVHRTLHGDIRVHTSLAG